MAKTLDLVENQQQFNKVVEEFKSHLLVVHFAAKWAPQCEQINDVLVELSKNSKQTKIIQLEAEDLPELSQKYEIIAVPTVIFIKNGEKVDRLDGANIAELSRKVQNWSSGTNIPTNAQSPKQDLDTKLKSLINQRPVMLFMKGSPTEPKCGFSRQTIQILNGHNIQFGYFDILTDNDVRQGLKTFSNWPTYPQLYSNGELVGGLDIIQELIETGELTSSLGTGNQDINERLKSLINSAPVMVFMKGNPDGPRCGFSRTLVDLLNTEGIKYSTFDILSDEEVRQGLKTFSDWPTYPQVYVKGELIGGLDILKGLLINMNLQKGEYGKGPDSLYEQTMLRYFTDIKEIIGQ